MLNPKNAGEAGHYEFLYKQGETSCEGGSRAPEPAGVATGALREPVSVTLSELLPGTEYTFCLVAVNNAGEQAIAPPVTFITSALGEEFSATVTATEATLNAEVGTGGVETSYHIEYGASSIAEVSTPEEHAVPSKTPLVVAQTLTGLKPATTYRYRFVVSNERGTIVGVEHAFTTAPAPGSEPSAELSQRTAPRRTALRAAAAGLPRIRDGLPAGERWAGRDRLIRLIEQPRAAVSGEAVVYASSGNFAEPKGYTLENTFLSRRGPEGWSNPGDHTAAQSDGR